MSKFHVITERVVTPAVLDQETGEIITPEIVTLQTSQVPLTPEEEAEADAAEAAAASIVPQSVTPYQARKALSQAGLRDAAEAAVNAASLDVQDAWHYDPAFKRNSPMIAALGASLGLTESQIDDLFRAAAAVV